MSNEKDLFWDVKRIQLYRHYFDAGIRSNDQFHRTDDLSKNLSYNVIYLEFISNALKREIHVVIKTELIKTFVITGMSIIETILYYVIKSRNLQKTESFDEIAVLSSNEKKVKGTFIKAETRLFKKRAVDKELEMSLDYMLKKAETNKLLGRNEDLYKRIKHLRKLRNKIHLYLIEEDFDHDINNFGSKEYRLMNESLEAVLSSELFLDVAEQKKELFDFLDY